VSVARKYLPPKSSHARYRGIAVAVAVSFGRLDQPLYLGLGQVFAGA
jgi:hypothetical protein